MRIYFALYPEGSEFDVYLLNVLTNGIEDGGDEDYWYGHGINGVDTYQSVIQAALAEARAAGAVVEELTEDEAFERFNEMTHGEDDFEWEDVPDAD